MLHIPSRILRAVFHAGVLILTRNIWILNKLIGFCFTSSSSLLLVACVCVFSMEQRPDMSGKNCSSFDEVRWWCRMQCKFCRCVVKKDVFFLLCFVLEDVMAFEWTSCFGDLQWIDMHERFTLFFSA